MTSFAWKVISSELVGPTRSLLREKDVLQLKGIFLSLDDDKDGMLTTLQLIDALKLLGFSTREKSVVKFSANASQLQASGLHALTFKTDFKTFVTVIGKEISAMKEVERDLSFLFEFMDSFETGHLSKKELKHLLVGVEAPSAMTDVEFTRFTKSLIFPPNSETISIADLKIQLIFGLLYSEGE